MTHDDQRIDYKYNEGNILDEIAKYVDSTYDQHYSQNKYQATEFIIDGGHGTGFCIGNILKYAQRYGHKDTPEEWRKDLMKVIHYAIMQLHVHDLEYPKKDFRKKEVESVVILDESGFSSGVGFAHWINDGQKNIKNISK